MKQVTCLCKYSLKKSFRYRALSGLLLKVRILEKSFPYYIKFMVHLTLDIRHKASPSHRTRFPKSRVLRKSRPSSLKLDICDCWCLINVIVKNIPTYRIIWVDNLSYNLILYQMIRYRKILYDKYDIVSSFVCYHMFWFCVKLYYLTCIMSVCLSETKIYVAFFTATMLEF